MDDYTPDSTPLAEALTAIGKITGRSESDPALMREALWEIRDLIEAATEQYRANIMAASKAETEALRAALGVK